MIEIILYILIPSLLSLLKTFLIMDANQGSDHAHHIDLIQSIKLNNNKFIKEQLLFINESNPYYPQLYHWVLSFLPEKVYKIRYKSITIVINIIETVAFNIFLYFLYKLIGFEKVVFLIANFTFITFPFSTATWNAKNMGISARGVGLILGQIYLYLLVSYVFSNNIWILILIYFLVFVILLTSQMAMQFVLLSLFFVVLVFDIPEIILSPFGAYLAFYFFMPKLAKHYIIGQYNHKRNYALFVARIFLLNTRPSIYRDFVYDFWIKLNKDFKKGINYIYHNPLVELFYGFTYLWFVIYFALNNNYTKEFEVLYFLVVISLALFYMTSLRWTRFLGEPQRYVEFTIPLISILFALTHGLLECIVMVAVSTLIIFLPRRFMQHSSGNKKINNRGYLLNYFQKEFVNKNNKIVVSNDAQGLKFISALGYKTCRVDTTRFFNNSQVFYSQFYNNSLSIISPLTLSHFILNYNPSIIVLNNSFYSFQVCKEFLIGVEITLDKTIENYSIYKIKQKGKLN